MKIAIAAAVTVFMSALPFAVNAAPVANFEVRLVVECVRGMAAFELETKDATKTPERLCVSPDVILSQADVVKVMKTQRDKYEGPILAITYGEAAQARVSQITRESVGHRMAIMTKGRVLSAPVILQPLLGTSLVVSGQTEDIDQLLKDLTNGARPL
ncbi:MAG TPA: hypothetical protein VFA87_09600 [Rhizomicrobium sp.]|nr:hypothetical protein [Rhizomicrobium sp.]